MISGALSFATEQGAIGERPWQFSDSDIACRAILENRRTVEDHEETNVSFGSTVML